MQKIKNCLWFDGQAEEAATFYTSLFPNSRIEHVMRSPVDTPAAKTGEVLLVEFTLAGTLYQALNGGPHYKFTPAVSMSVTCDDQAEVDRLWEALGKDGGQEVECGWITDKYGLSWQIVPKFMEDVLRGDDPERLRRAFGAMMTMKKFDVEELKRAAA